METVKVKVTRTDGVVVEAEGTPGALQQIWYYLVPWQVSWNYQVPNVCGGGVPIWNPEQRSGAWPPTPLAPGEHVLPDGTKITIY